MTQETETTYILAAEYVLLYQPHSSDAAVHVDVPGTETIFISLICYDVMIANAHDAAVRIFHDVEFKCRIHSMVTFPAGYLEGS